MQRDIYKITILNWEHHNKGHKKTFKKILLNNSFCTDAKIRTLSMTSRWCFLNLLVMCGDIARDTIELSSKHLRDIIECNRNIDGVLGQMQELQLLTFEKIAPFRIEKKRNEENRNEKNVTVLPKIKKLNDPEKNKVAWQAYREAYLARWRQEPIQDQKNNSAISRIVQRVGGELAPEILKFFVLHNDGFYIKSTHSLGLALKDVESLRTQFLNGKAITMGDVRKFEARDHYRDQMARIEKGEL